MKKLIFLIAMLVLGLTAIAQNKIDTTGMSDYEKYYYAKEQLLLGEPLTNTADADTKTQLQLSQVENDDVYYLPSTQNDSLTKEQIKLKKQDLRLEKKRIRVEQNAAYYDAYQDVYEDFYYASLINRFNYGYSFSYYSPYWRFSYSWYDPFFTPWYWDYPSYYQYYPYYSYRYYDWNSRYWNHSNNYYHNSFYTYNYYNINHNKTPRYNLLDTRSNNGSRRVSPSNYSSAYLQKSRSANSQTLQKTPNYPAKSNMQTTRTTPPIQKPEYNRSGKAYTPSYSTPRIPAKPQYNNSRPTTTTTNNQTRVSTGTTNSVRTSVPTQNRPAVQSRTQTQTRTYSTPTRSTTSTRSSVNYSTPTRSTSRSSSSSYSTPSRSSSSRSSSSSYSTPSRSSSSSSSNSSTSKSSSGSSGGRRK